MEKLLNPYDKEYMKMAMLKHEEIFREQVYELHRLYQTQKLLMKNMSSSRQQVKDQVVNHHNILDSNKKTRQCFDLEIRPNDQEHIAESVGQDNNIEDETELELTLGLSSYNRRRKTANSDSAPSFSSSNSTGSSSQIIKPSTSARNPRNDLNGHKWGLENFPVSNPSFQLGARQSNPNVEEQFRQDSLNNPPWLFQVLSLNMT
ncbi:uncharacterized protein LOC107805273 [Nicotiana tabacum]|uniref:Uncharacterized protein n=1 Tax=Nicotiana tabacum TaxID=4097 RepID=A0A1S4B7B7_TOBAC|nr:uncharacterized protein LOC104118528 [Nicotiana tomentosiformis]XP_009628087.1 uncharacterized protein LOC104118528 [Nicotiana tomentosiformis]XP_016484757.1 PREDICTED: uncharacterized protein LOC107805273 [Nicotiana tabacum]XP_016484758.1 PREDICTED: uncharacterized protein LOC107805273 [Nicotiana tabacum]XP_016484759.1 PREDICTED: uncharacterized protein LOC107805273 [Nicotiana tabacum]